MEWLFLEVMMMCFLLWMGLLKFIILLILERIVIFLGLGFFVLKSFEIFGRFLVIFLDLMVVLGIFVNILVCFMLELLLMVIEVFGFRK